MVTKKRVAYTDSITQNSCCLKTDYGLSLFLNFLISSFLHFLISTQSYPQTSAASHHPVGPCAKFWRQPAPDASIPVATDARNRCPRRPRWPREGEFPPR